MTDQPYTGLEYADSGQRIYEPDGDKLSKFLADRAHVSIIRGPIASGTSSGCCMKIYLLALEQRVGYGGKRRSRWAIVRNTYPDLKNTTIKTWLDWFPENQYGRMYLDRPPRHEIRIGDIELDVHFLALDDDKDIQKLRSLELTGVWFNELEFIPKTIFDEAESRTGRYPAKKEGGSNWDGVIADLNAPNEDHWLPQMTGEVPPAEDLSDEEIALLKWPANWSYFVQPPALLENRSPDGKTVIGYRVNPEAENLRWIKDGYYEEKMQGKKKAWIDSRLRNQIVFVIDGDPVWTSYNPDTHMSALPLTPIPGYEVIVGLDFGRRPSAVFLQAVNNRVFIQYEFRRYGMAATTFAPLFKRFLEQHYPGFTYRLYGDPKGQDRGQADERTAYDVFAANGMRVAPAPVKNNNIETRIAAVDAVLNEMHMGKPRFVLSPSGCPTLKAAMAGRYHVKKAALGDPEPVKDEYSDVADALQYAFLGMGEGRRMIGLTAATLLRPHRVSGNSTSLRRVT